MREKLLEWARKKFGEVSNEDVFNLKEEVVPDKKGRRIREITMFLKKKKGIQEDWLKKDVFNAWIDEIKSILGEVEVLKIISAEANEMRFVGMKQPETGYEEMAQNYYKYEFSLTVWKKV